MKKIIEGLIYNTETAAEIYESDAYNNGTYAGSDTLYKTKHGAYFVAVDSNGQDCWRTDNIQAMSRDEAIAWLDGEQPTERQMKIINEEFQLEEA